MFQYLRVAAAAASVLKADDDDADRCGYDLKKRKYKNPAIRREMAKMDEEERQEELTIILLSYRLNYRQNLQTVHDD